jgi:hypothetical protein
MATRLFDATLVGLILTSLLFLGMLFLLIDIPTFNHVDPFLLQMTVLGICLGLAFGLFAGNSYTKIQLRVLSEKNELKGLGSRRLYYALFLGLGLFLFLSSLVFYYKSAVLGNMLVTFVISATFTAYISRLISVSSWEKSTRKTILMASNKLYVISQITNISKVMVYSTKVVTHLLLNGGETYG